MTATSDDHPEVVVAQFASTLAREHHEALNHLTKLANWGWGENAPYLAKLDWQNARDYLTKVTGSPTGGDY